MNKSYINLNGTGNSLLENDKLYFNVMWSNIGPTKAQKRWRNDVNLIKFKLSASKNVSFFETRNLFTIPLFLPADCLVARLLPLVRTLVSQLSLICPRSMVYRCE